MKYLRAFRNIVAALLLLATIGIASAAPASAAACTQITNPAISGYGYWLSPWGIGYWPGNTNTLYTGPSSSGCNDINISNISGGFCNDFGSVTVFVMYLSGGNWVSDNQNPTQVNCWSSNWVVVGAGYANNTPFRIMINMGSPPTTWPTFKLFV